MSGEPAPEPLTPSQEETWRALVRLMVLMPRAIDEDLTRRGGPSLTRYVVLMRLSEAPDQTLRMSDIAEAASISPSRMTRIVQPMIAEGLVTRRAAPRDGRASLVVLTDVGLQRLRAAWPAHVAGVRALVMDHLAPDDLADFARMTKQILNGIEGAAGPARGRCPAEDRDDHGCLEAKPSELTEPNNGHNRCDEEQRGVHR